jgi:integrase
MAKIHKLAAAKVAKATKVGMYGDGGGLWLQVRSSENRCWIFRFEREEKVRYMGLGSLSTVSLADAREQAARARRLLQDKIDPIAARDRERAQAKVEARKSITFKAAAEIYIEAHKAGWRNEKHADQWLSTLETYAYPVFGDLPVPMVDTTLVMKALEPIWKTKTETASRVRGRIEAVLNWAKTRGYRTGENPATWKGHLENLLPARSKVRRVEHHSALPYDELATFMTALRIQNGVAARALEILILTATRTGEVIGARWDEIDLAEALWTIPAERTKTHREQRVPLTPAAVGILKLLLLHKTAESDFIFPGAKRGAPISNMAMLVLLDRMERGDLTVHGFRSSFRDWAAEQTAFPSEVAEMALGHAVGDKVEAAYRRGDLFEKRRKLMEAWANYCATPAKDGKIIPMRRASE